MKKQINPIFYAIWKYHLAMIDLCNIRQSLDCISDKKAEESNKKHCMGAIKSAYFGGFASDKVNQMFSNEES